MASYHFSNLLGVPYGGGSLTFTEDGNAVIAAAGNRASFKDLTTQQSFALGVECQQNIDHVLLCPSVNEGTTFVILIDEGGLVLYLNLTSLVSLDRFHIKRRISAAAASPNGKYLAIAYGNTIAAWRLPCKETKWQFSRLWEQKAHGGRILSLEFALNSRFFVSGSVDTLARVWQTESGISGDNREDRFIPFGFVDCNSPVRYAAIDMADDKVYLIGQGGSLYAYEWSNDLRPLGQVNKAMDVRCLRERREKPAPFSFEIGEVERQREATVALDDDVEMGESNLDPSKRPLLQSQGNDSDDEAYMEPYKKLRRQDDEEKARLLKRAETIFTTGWWKILAKVLHQLPPRVCIRTAKYHPRGLIALGLSNGVFCLRKTPTFDILYNLSIDSNPIDALAFNSDGEWLALGMQYSGRMVVWEWRSETCILQDAGDVFGSRSVCYMPPGIVSAFDKTAKMKDSQERMIGTVTRNILASGSQDGRVKLWDATTGFAFHTIQAHSGPITQVAFTPQLNAVLSASYDGTVKAHDLLKYKTFRTMTAPSLDDRPAPQLTCLAIDSSGEIVAAGSGGSDCRLFLWSLQTGRILDDPVAHSQPISAIAFSNDVNTPGMLASTSLDGTLRVWDVLGRAGKGGVPVLFEQTAPAVALAWDPRANKRICVSYLSGLLVFWDIETEDIVGQIECLRDIAVGRTTDQRYTADGSRKNEAGTQVKYSRDPDLNNYFSSIAYAANGESLVCASKRSPKVCVYSTKLTQLIYSFNLTHNRSLDGLLRQLNSSMILDGGLSLHDIDVSDDDEDAVDRLQNKLAQANILPGAKLGKAALKAERKKLFVWGVAVTADSQQMAIATSHGIFCYMAARPGLQLGTRNHVLFQKLSSFTPVYLDEETTTINCLQTLKEGNFSKALRLALGLNDRDLIGLVYTRIEIGSIPLVVKMIPIHLLPPMLNFIRTCLQPEDIKDIRKDIDPETTALRSQLKAALELHLTWLTNLLWIHSKSIQSGGQHMSKAYKAATDALDSTYVAEIRTLLLLILKSLRERKGMMLTLYTENEHLTQYISSLLVANE